MVEEEKHTDTPWEWDCADGSMMTLCPTGREEDAILVVRGCSACRERDKLCGAPSKADAEFIIVACNSHASLVRQRDKGVKELTELCDCIDVALSGARVGDDPQVILTYIASVLRRMDRARATIAEIEKEVKP